MNNENSYSIESSIPKEEFELVHKDESLHDTKFETRPIGWLEDSVRRFAKNKASVVGAVIIFIILLFAIIVPAASPKAHSSMEGGFKDKEYATVLPRIRAFKGSGFWDGTKVQTISETNYKLKLYSDANDPFFDKNSVTFTEEKLGSTVIRTYSARMDSYALGTKTVRFASLEEYKKLLEYENSKEISYSDDNKYKSIVKPAVDYETYIEGELVTWLHDHGVENTSSIVDNMTKFYNQNPYVYYKLVPTKNRGNTYSDVQFEPLLVNDNVEDLYIRNSKGELVFYTTNASSMIEVRVDYASYAEYKYGFAVNYVFGANQYGEDIFLRLAKGARFSLLLGIGISLINFIIGLIYGAVAGYYGGRVDLVMERITDIIANIPTIIIMTIAQIQLTNNAELKAVLGTAGTIVAAILIAFVYNGWVGVAGTTRMQFYRFKGQEYVLASRTLGAKDRRLIFKHILPNAAGTLVTSSVLMIPGIIFSESSLSYLGIINFSTSGICSVGALLNEGQQANIAMYPHVLLFPALLITLLMISFNLFGNGLRDAFNTTLRGSEG